MQRSDNLEVLIKYFAFSLHICARACWTTWPETPIVGVYYVCLRIAACFRSDLKLCVPAFFAFKPCILVSGDCQPADIFETSSYLIQ